MFAAVSISDSLQKSLDSFFNFLPNLLAFLVILAIGFLVARLLAAGVHKALEALGIDRALSGSDAGQTVERLLPGATPSAAIARVTFWLLFVFVLSAAIGALKLPAVTTFMNQVLAYLPNVIAAIVIFVLAAAVAGLAVAAVKRVLGETPTAKVVATAVPSIVMLIAVFMILNQLKIAPQIVQITYTALLGSVALASALAFGLGGRDVAGRMLDDAYRRGRERTREARPDGPAVQTRRPVGER